MIKVLTILLTIFSLSLNTFAQNAESFQLNDYDRVIQLDERFKFTSLVLKVGSKIDEELEGEFKNPEDVLQDTEKLAQIMSYHMEDFENFYAEKLLLNTDQRLKFNKAFKYINWANTIQTFKKAHLGIEVFFKRNGIGLGLAMMAGFLTEYLMPTILFKIGLGSLIPFSMFTPWGAIYSLIPNLINKARVNSILEETLGTKDRVKFYKAQLDEFAKIFQEKNPDFYLYPIESGNENGALKTIVIHKNTFWKKIISIFLKDKKELNYSTLTKFLKQNKINSPSIEWIITNRKIEKDLKVALIINHLYTTNNSDHIDLFEKRFSEKVKVVNDTKNPDKIYSWIKQMKSATTIEELTKISLDFEYSMNPILMIKIWEDMLLPHFIEKLHINYTQARFIVLNFEAFKAKLFNLNEEWNQLSKLDKTIKLQNEIKFLLKQFSEGKAFNGCKKTNKDVFDLL